MSSVFSKIGSVIKGNPLGAIGTGAGIASSVIGNRKQNKYLDNQLAYQKLLLQMAQHPELIAARAKGFEQPLSEGLKQNVGRDVQAQLEQRGLGASPSIAGELMTQTMAPYLVHNQDVAIDEAFRSLGLPGQATPAQFSQGPDFASLISQLLKGGGSGSASGPTDLAPWVNGPSVFPSSSDSDSQPDLTLGGEGGGDISSLIASLGA